MGISVSLVRSIRIPSGEPNIHPSYDGDLIANGPSMLLRNGVSFFGEVCSFDPLYEARS